MAKAGLIADADAYGLQIADYLVTMGEVAGLRVDGEKQFMHRIGTRGMPDCADWWATHRDTETEFWGQA